MTYQSGDILTWDLTTSGNTVTDISLESEQYLASGLNIKEGWGFVARPLGDGRSYLYASDSTTAIKEIDPSNWSLVREIKITLQSGATVPYLNELEIVTTSPTTSRYLFANQF